MGKCSPADGLAALPATPVWRDAQKMEVYFLRHGETAWNRDKRIQGSTEWTDLTDEGVRAAETARDGLKASELRFDRLYSSPYRRALHTARIIGAGLGLEPMVDSRLREISFGPYEGTEYGEGRFADGNIRACFKDPPRYVARDGAETFDQAAARVRDFFEGELAPLAGRCSRVMAVAHGGILRTVLRLASGMPLEDFWKIPQPNCCAHVVDYSSGRLSLKARAVVFARKTALALACAALVALPAAAEPVARIKARRTAEIKASNWTVGCETLDRGLCEFAAYKDYLPMLGVKRIRLQGGWARCEKEKGKYDFSWLDEPVDFCRTNGISVLLETSYGNPVYPDAGGWDLGGGFPKGEEGLAAWDRWVEALARHFKGRVADWAMWNEPDLAGQGRVSKTPEEIGAFNVRTAKILKRVIPEARISALSLAHNDPVLLERCLKAMEGSLDLFDSVIYHGYSANPDDSYPKVEEQKRVIAKYAPHLKLVQGENGAPSSLCTAYALKNIPWNDLSQAKWDVRRMLGDLGHDVASSVFTIMEYVQARRPLNTKGLLERTGDSKVKRVKPAFWAVRNVAAVFDSSVVRDPAAKARLSAPRPVADVYVSPRGRIVAYWDASNRPDESLHPVSGELALHGAPLENPVLVDLVSGDVFAADAAKPSADGCVYRVPVHDYPWLLAEKGALPLEPWRARPTATLSYDPSIGIRGMGDLRLPSSVTKDTQMVLAIHGGGWSSGTRERWEGVAEFFTRDLGFASFNIDYRLAGTDGGWPACGDDCLAAARFLLDPAFKARYGLSYDKIWICGGSAGGHLTLWTLVNLPPGSVAGAISISSIGRPEDDALVHAQRYVRLFGREPAAGDFAAMDPCLRVRPGMAPVLSTHTAGDKVVPISSHQAFAEAYRAAGNTCRFFSYPANVEPNEGGHCIWRNGVPGGRLLVVLENQIRAFVEQRQRGLAAGSE